MTTTYVPLPSRGGKGFHAWVAEKILLGQTASQYGRSLVTPFNVVATAILLLGLGVAALRVTGGLGGVTNLTDTYPWGLWIGFDVLCGVALAAGGYTIAFAVYIFGLRQYHAIVRPAILTGFLGYFFVVVGILFDLGRPWRLPFPFFVSPGITSVMFSVGLHVFLYLICLFIEFTPPIFEWLGWRRWRAVAIKATFAVTIAGVTLSTLHQAALGALFLIAPSKLHPLWYSPLLPIFFFVSSAFVGLAMVIVESTLSDRIFGGHLASDHKQELRRLTIGVARAAALLMFTYLGLKALGFVHALGWEHVESGLGAWFLLEVVGFVALPAQMFLWGARNRHLTVIRLAAAITVVGIIANRLTISLVAFNWQLAERYFPRWTELAITIAIVTLFLLTFRWIVNRMPVLHEHADFPREG